MSNTEVVHLSPSEILADQNSRFGLRKGRIASLVANIIEVGGVMNPVEVEELAEPVDGMSYRLISGHYRHAAVAELEKNQPALGVTLPVIITAAMDPKERLVRQISENHERENQSPMDKAVAMNEMLDAGFSKQEVRERFSTPGVGRSGSRVQPASNSHVNMTLSFLELPKKIQKRIHEGEISVGGAYELVKVFKEAPDKFDAVLVRIEADATKLAEKEAAAEAKLVEAEAAQDEHRKAAEEAQTEADKAKKEADSLTAKTLEAKKKAASLASAKMLAESAEDKKKLTDEFKAAEKEAQESEKARALALKEAEKLQKKAEGVAMTAAERAEKLKKVREEAAKKAGEKPENKKGVGSAAVKAAATSEGATSKPSPLNASQMREVVHDLAIPGGDIRVEKIFKEVEAAFNGLIGDRELYDRLIALLDSIKSGKVKAS